MLKDNYAQTQALSIAKRHEAETLDAEARMMRFLERAGRLKRRIEFLPSDDEIAERMDAGRRALMLRGDDESGPYQSPMEDGMQHFHEWYRREMQPA